MGEKIKSYKGFNKDLNCKDHQYKIGETYEQEEPIKVCERGFHACEQPIEVFNYYPPASSRYCEVEQSGDINREGSDSKVASSRIKIGAEIGIPGIVKAQIEYVKAHTTTEHTDPKLATAGEYGAATAGEYGAATAGNRGAATAGYAGAATAGNRGAATSRGRSEVGAEGLAVARGNNVKVKGGLGAILVLCEEQKNDFSIKEWAAVLVDGKDVKPDTWYRLNNGQIEEVTEV